MGHLGDHSEDYDVIKSVSCSQQKFYSLQLKSLAVGALILATEEIMSCRPLVQEFVPKMSDVY